MRWAIRAVALVSWLTVAVACTLFAQPATKSGAAAAGRLALEACRLQGLEEELRCGRLEVLENPSGPAGRRISLNVVVMPAHSASLARDALFLLRGGPGAAATTLALPAARLFGRIRQERDIVLVDRRGTGDLNPLNCKLPVPSANTPRG